MTVPASTENAESGAVRAVIVALSLLVVVLVVLVTYVMPKPEAVRGPSGLATLNACINFTVSVCLVVGFRFIKRGQLARHRASMLTAFVLSSIFLVSYLAHHARVGSVPFEGEGFIRIVYFALLIPHIVLAAVVLPLALFTIYRGWTGRVALHKKVARITLPIWLFVSVSGVLVYLLLYHA
jgi:putative membrane protein